MKKHLFFALALSCATLSLTACHDDDSSDGSSEDASYIYSTSSIGIDESIIGSSTAKMGLFTYVLTSNSISVYCYNLGDKQTICENYMNADNTLTAEGIAYLGSNFYGGFTPTWYPANSEDDDSWYLTPAGGSYKSNNAALLCNPGVACKAMFHKQIAASASGLASIALVKEPVCLYACPIELYNDLESDSVQCVDNYVALPAGDEIRLVVYGFVDSFNLSNWDKTLNSFKSAFSSATSGGTKCSSYITLAKADDKGKITVNKDWQKIDLADLKDFYCFECYIEVVKKDGTKDSNYELPDDLNMCLVSDISFNGGIGSLLDF